LIQTFFLSFKKKVKKKEKKEQHDPGKWDSIGPTGPSMPTRFSGVCCSGACAVRLHGTALLFFLPFPQSSEPGWKME
jgi:hypothetical protein